MNKLAFVLLALAFFGGALAAPAATAAIKVDCNKPPQSVSHRILFLIPFPYLFSLHQDPDKCCKTPMFFKDDLVASCDASIKAKSTNVTAECMATCLLTKNNVLDAQGSMKKDALTAFLIKTTNDAAWNKALTSAANACVNDGELVEKKQ